jgi:hypothetical protein
LTASGFVYAANQESHDAFCASCHTEPETTYVARSTTSPAVDLASYHTVQGTKCIDCHSGQGVPGRVQAELLGARNAALWYTHSAVQPAKLTVPIEDANCLKCHAEVTQEGYSPEKIVTLSNNEMLDGGEAGPNHWHERLSEWRAKDPTNAQGCTSCHPGHALGGTAKTGFQVTDTTLAVCDACHNQLHREGGGG